MPIIPLKNGIISWRLALIFSIPRLFLLSIFIFTLGQTPAFAEWLTEKEDGSTSYGEGTTINFLTPDQASQVRSQATSGSSSPETSADVSSEKTASQKRNKTATEKFFSRPFLQVGDAVDEWQKGAMKADDVNLELRQFGLDFFAKEAFPADELALAGPDYIIGPGDTLIITVWGNINGQYRVTVGRNGEIAVPKIGVFSVWGQTFTEVEETIRQQISRYFTNFDMSVTLDALRSIRVVVVGEVQNPGSYTVSSLSTVLSTLTAAGGPTGTGSLRHIQLRRSGTEPVTIDLYDLFQHGDKSQDLRLQAGDTIFVPVVGPLVGVAGDVRRPGIYELAGGESVEDALKMAGGPTATAYLQKVHVERFDRSLRKKIVLDVDLSQQERKKELTLQDRDLVKVDTASALTGKYARIYGHVARAGTYELLPGMRLADLLAEQDLLPGYYPELLEVLRLQPPDYKPERVTLNLRRVMAQDPEHNILLREYDEIRIFSRNEMEEIPDAAISGAVLNPGTYRLYEKMNVRDLVTAAGNVRLGAYLEEAEITRYIPSGRKTLTERLLIDLEKALGGDPTHNLVLRPNDHLFVRSIPGYGEKLTVQITGEVLFPGTYAITQGETLVSVIERAGGFTEDAYLRGAIFSRETLKDDQRRQTERLIAEQEQTILQISSEMATGALDEESLAASQAALEARQKLVQKLRQVPINGRMVVNLQPLDELAETPDNIELMAGDTLAIPQNPQTVTVLGEVYNPTSLAYRPGRTVGDYLAKVGGTREEANEDEMFIVRADGSVLSKQQGGFGLHWDRENFRWVTGGFSAAKLLPGDTLLVPQKLKKGNYLRDIRDITQIFYQLGLGAAAISVL